MLVLVIGVSVWSVVEVAKLHLDHTPRWPPEITPLPAQKLHHVRGRYRIDIDLLAKYWRKESVAAAKRMANRLGVRCVVGLYPWMAIWEAEGLAPPAKSHWAMLQQDHMTTNEVALRLDCDARTIRRYVTNPPDDFPLPVFGNGKPWLWRAAQIQAYVRGTPLPRFRRSTSHRATNGSDGNELPALRAQAPRPSTFDPFCSQ
jgi:hypothetical protein